MKNLVTGMHIAVSRGLYTHHGIYVGSGRVVYNTPQKLDHYLMIF